ncbi:MAG: hypothetical protein HYZ74_00085, partial [Elusimicrobia bacterium]|nr:hypothetical protein [Elusimicrobiota bacterium]
MTLQTADLVVADSQIVLNSSTMGDVARASHTATLMTNGCVLVVGGNKGGVAATESAEVYNPATHAWTTIRADGAAPTKVRYNHTATLLNDGKVLICGGQDATGAAIQACEFYTPTSCTAGSFGSAGTLLQARYNHTAVLLKDGKVWFAGGFNPSGAISNNYLPTTERYNPSANTYQSASPLIEGRSNHTATLLGDGKVLVVGGYNLRDALANRGILETAEIYDPVANTITPAAPMTARRSAHASVLSASGEVMVLGGLGNITTTYVTSGLAGPLLAGSTVSGTFSDTSTMTITGANGISLAVEFKLSKPIIGRIAVGEVLLSSPIVKFPSGAVHFIPGNQADSSGIRIDLAGTYVGCPTPVRDSNCGYIKSNYALTNDDVGTVVFYDRRGVAPTNSPSVNAGILKLSAPLTSGTAPLVAGSTLQTTITIPMAKELIGSNIIRATMTITAASFAQSSSFTVALIGGSTSFIGL